MTLLGSDSAFSPFFRRAMRRKGQNERVREEIKKKKSALGG